MRDKTFFFPAYEGYRQHWVFPELGYVPSAAFRAQVAATIPGPHSNSRRLSCGADSDRQSQHRRIYELTPDRSSTKNSAMFRIDQHFSDKTTAFVRVQHRSSGEHPAAGEHRQLSFGPAAADFISRQCRDRTLHIFSPTLLNEVKFGFNRGTADTTDINQTGLPYSFAVTGFTTLKNNKISTGVGNSFSGIDNYDLG